MKLDKRVLRAAGTVLVALLAVVFWWFQGDGDDTTHVSDPGTSATSDAAPAESGEPESTDGADELGQSPTPPDDTRAPAPTTATPEQGATPDAPSYDARTGTDPESGLPWVAVWELPVEAEETLELIDAGGPYPHDRDDITFGNYEGILPSQQRGYYREYTVPTPGLSHRGARRIVTGDTGEYYWTEDHYASFERIDWPVE